MTLAAGQVAIAEDVIAAIAVESGRATAAETLLTNSQTGLVSVKSFGAVGNGIANDSAAFQAAINAGQRFFIPPGVYALASNLSVTLSGNALFAMSGAGKAATTLAFAFNRGLQISMSGASCSIQISDMTFATAGSGITSAIDITSSAQTQTHGNNTSQIQNVAFRGLDAVNGPPASNYWVNCIAILNASYFNYISCDFWGSASSLGIGVHLLGTDDVTQSSVVHNFTSCFFYNLANGIYYGPHVQGVALVQCNGLLNGSCVHVPVGSIGPQLSINASQFYSGGSASVAIFGNMADVLISNNLFLNDYNGATLSISNGGRMSITANSFVNLGSGASAMGIVISGNNAGQHSIITGNSIQGYAGASGNGIFLGASSTGWNVQSNCYAFNTVNVGNAGSSNTVGGGSA